MTSSALRKQRCTKAASRSLIQDQRRHNGNQDDQARGDILRGPREVFETLMDAKKHAAFTGAPAQIDRRLGGRFTLYGGQLNGTIIELEQDKRIVQDWRGSRWPEGHFSRLSFTLTPLAGGRRTQLSMTQTGLPTDHFDDINQGWHVYYWTKMAHYFRDERVAVVRRFMEEFKNKANLDTLSTSSSLRISPSTCPASPCRPVLRPRRRSARPSSMPSPMST